MSIINSYSIIFYQLFSYQSLHGKQNILADSKMPYNTANQMHPQTVQ